MINCVAFSPSGRLFAVGQIGGMVTVWHTTTGQKISTWTPGGEETIAVGFLTEDRLITGNIDDGVCLRDAKTGAEVLRYQSPEYGPNGIFVLSRSRKLLLLYDTLFQADTGEFIATIPAGSLLSAISVDDRFAVFEAGWGAATLNGMPDGRKIRTFQPHTSQGPHGEVDISPDNAFVLSAPLHVYVWQADGTPVNTLTEYPVAIARFTPDSRAIVCGCHTGEIVLWDFLANRNIWQHEAHTQQVFALDISPDGKYVLSGSFDNTAAIHDTRTGEEILQVTV